MAAFAERDETLETSSLGGGKPRPEAYCRVASLTGSGPADAENHRSGPASSVPGLTEEVVAVPRTAGTSRRHLRCHTTAVVQFEGSLSSSSCPTSPASGCEAARRTWEPRGSIRRSKKLTPVDALSESFGEQQPPGLDQRVRGGGAGNIKTIAAFGSPSMNTSLRCRSQTMHPRSTGTSAGPAAHPWEGDAESRKARTRSAEAILLDSARPLLQGSPLLGQQRLNALPCDCCSALDAGHPKDADHHAGMASCSESEGNKRATIAVHEDLELRILTERLKLVESQRKVAALRCAQFMKVMEASLCQPQAQHKKTQQAVPCHPQAQHKRVQGPRPGTGSSSSPNEDDEQYWSSPNFYRGKYRGALPKPSPKSLLGTDNGLGSYALGSRLPLDSYFLDNTKRKRRSMRPPNRHCRRTGRALVTALLA